ncbi:MAG: hypothetical protein M3Y72_20690 [Acidobacteriota bacterium]|nr:hypothetical protein [Acidobacteriota bacterium]
MKRFRYMKCDLQVTYAQLLDDLKENVAYQMGAEHNARCSIGRLARTLAESQLGQ